MGIATVRKLLPSDSKVFLLEDFIREFAPALLSSDPVSIATTIIKSNNENVEEKVGIRIPASEQSLRNVIIAPLKTCRIVPHINKANCREPVHTLVDDVVYSLVRRQERLRRRKFHPACRSNKRKRPYGTTNIINKVKNNSKDNDNDGDGDTCKNALTHGFKSSKEGDAPPPSGMRLGVSYLNPNENVMYCKSSPLIRKLHRLVGDEVLRMIFLHTRCFMPIASTTTATTKGGAVMLGTTDSNNNGNNNINYILLCGPPMCTTTNINNGYRHRTIVKTKIPTEKSEGNKCSKWDPPSDSSITTTSQKKKKKKRRLFPRTILPDSHLEANESISRYALMYCDDYIPHIGLPKSHPFQQRLISFQNNTSSDNNAQKQQYQQHDDYRFMLNFIFDLHLENKNKQKRIRKRLGESARIVCEKIWKGHTSGCDYSRLFERHCGLPPYVKEVSKKPSLSEGSNLLARIARAFTPKDRIVSFLGSVLRRVFPIIFWGSERNFQSVMASVKSFVHLRRKERLTNKNLMHGISVTQIKWLYHDKDCPNSAKKDGGNNTKCSPRSRKRQRTDHENATELTLKILRWLFQEGFIIPLLRSCFYVTETEFSGQQLQYYRKPVWSLFRCLSIQKLIRGKHFKSLSYAQARQNLKQQQMGLSTLRLLPKSTGMRPIAQLSRSRHFNFQQIARNTVSTTTTTTRSSKKRHRIDDELQQSNCRPSKISRDLEKTATRNSHLIGSSSLQLKPKNPEESSYSSSRLPTNIILGKVLDVLSYECGQRDKPYGNGIDSLQHFYQRYRDYVIHIKKQRNQTGDGEKEIKLFFAKVDIEKCYDRINQDYLLGLVQNLVLHNTYVVQRVKMDCANFKRGGGENIIRYKKIVEAVDDYRSFYIGEHELARGNQNTIFDLFKCSLVEKNKVLDLLREHLLQHTVISSGRYGRKILQQSSGISQGSSLSMLLCNLYYGNVEESMFEENREFTDSSEQMVDTVEPRGEKIDDDFMSRFVDDFIFITPDKDSFQGFLDRTYRGKPNLGAKINPSKTMVNVDASVRVETEGGDTRHVPVCCSNRRNRDGTILFPWCGLLFNTQTGETFIDYERFRRGKLRDGLTVDYDGNEGKRMEYRMQSFIFPRCLPILYDSSINSFDTIVTNFYQMMLLAAAKTAEYLRGHASLLPNSSTVYNIDYVLRCIRGLSQFALQDIKSKFKCSLKKRFDFSKMIGIDKCLASFLCWKAFYDVFSYLSDFMVITRRILEESSSTLVNLRHKRKMDIQRIVSRALEDFQIRYMIQK
jgi:hypothetical protein